LLKIADQTDVFSLNFIYKGLHFKFFEQNLVAQITACAELGGSLPYATTKAEFEELANIFHSDYEAYAGRIRFL